MTRCQVCGTELADTEQPCPQCDATPGTPDGAAVGAPPTLGDADDTPVGGMLFFDGFEEAFDPGTPTPRAAQPAVLPAGAQVPAGDPPPFGAQVPADGATPMGAQVPADGAMPTGGRAVAPQPPAPLPALLRPPGVPAVALPPTRPRRRRRAVPVILGLVAVLVVLAAVGYGVTTRLRPTADSKSPTAKSTVGGSRGAHSSTPQAKPPPTSSTTAHSNAVLAALAQQDASGIVSIAATTCGGTGVGSGFLVSPTLVLTNAHVVDGAATLGVTSGGSTKGGQVIGIDDGADVALIELASALPGHVFSLGASAPPLGTAVGVVGYLSSTSLRMVPGLIGTAGQTISNAGQSRTGLLQTNAAVSPAQSGGPVLATDGAVVGVADTAIPAQGSAGYIVPAAMASPLVTSWEQQPAPPPPPSCVRPTGPTSPGSIRNTATGPDAAGVAAVLTTYFNAIDSGNYAGAYAELGPQTQSTISEPTFAVQDATTYDYNIDVQAVSTVGTGTDLANVSFTSLQDAVFGPSGTTCDNWTLQYTMIKSGSAWLIDGAAGLNGVTVAACP